MIKKLFVYAVSLPLYYIMYLIPPKKDLWIFGAWLGDKYFDNPKFLFLHVRNNHSKINTIWITKDKSICNQIDIIYKYSLKGVYYSIVGEVYIVTHSTYADLFQFINNNSRKVVQLWHGIPIKKIGYDDFRHSENKLKIFLLPFLKARYSLVISSSEVDKINMATAFKTPKHDVVVTGYPRNDIFSTDKLNLIKFKVLYAPTLRDKVNDEVNLFDSYGFKSEEILNFLEEHNIYLDIKMHPANKIDIRFKNAIDSKYIQFLESKIEINDILQDYSIVISDYSGLYVDYLLTNRPIIFAPFDYEKYITKDRELYYDYDEVTPGPKCKNWGEVLEWIEKFKEGPNLFAKERKLMKDRFHKYQDGKSCERVYNEIIKLGNK